MSIPIELRAEAAASTATGPGDEPTPQRVRERVLRRPSPAWRPRYIGAVVAFDAAAAVAGATVAGLLRFGTDVGPLGGARVTYPYQLVLLIYVAGWLLVAAASGTYDRKRLGVGSEEYRRILNAAWRVFAIGAGASYLGQLDLSRSLLVVAIPATAICSLSAHYLARRWLHRQRTAGFFVEDLLVVGTVEHASRLIRHFRRSPFSGYRVHGAVVGGHHLAIDVDGEPVPVLGEPAHLFEVIDNTEADAIAIADVETLGGRLRELAWHLEGTGIALLVAPAITDVAGPRVEVRPAAGLPLLSVEEPRFEGAPRVVKATFDRLLALLAAVVSAPLVALIALAVSLDSPGGPFFRQVRVGKDGRLFTCWKFRTMRTGADDEKSALEHLNEHDGVLFKIRDDPRLTRTGRWLRRFSLDELPQLLNVLRGEMSLVGPRPAVPDEVQRYATQVGRRLLVKPGLTGLWQVSGRADLPWEEAVRLDLYYVENWSIAMDLTILLKTFTAVLRGRGAY